MARTPTETLHAVRRALFWLLALGLAGMLAELLLTKHTDGTLQLIPVLILSLGLLLLGVTAGRWETALRGLRIFFAIAALSGAVGSGLHYLAKAEFALERQPDLKGLELFWQAVFRGTNPPLLAPGAMIALGLLGFVWTMTLQSRGMGEGVREKPEFRVNVDSTTGEPQ